jgi:hypothetical protein
VQIQRVRLALRLDATITVYDDTGAPSDWLKPGSEASVTWNGIPSEPEVKLAYQYLEKRNADALERVIAQTQTRLRNR